MQKYLYILLFMTLITCADASTNLVVLKYVTNTELVDTVIPADVLVVNRDNHEDLRLGDGSTTGGVRIQNSAALTNVAYNYYASTYHNGHRIFLNEQSALYSTGSITRLAIGSNIIWSIYAESETDLGKVLRTEYDEASTQLVVYVNIPGNNTEPDISYMPGGTGSWHAVTNAIYTWPPEADPFLIRIPVPTNAASGFYKIYFAAVETGNVMVVSAKLYVPRVQALSLTLGDETRTSWPTESDPVWLAEKSAYATGTPVYVESDPVWTSEKSGYATGTPVYTESDPVWTAASGNYLAKSGGTMTGPLTLSGNGTVFNLTSSSPEQYHNILFNAGATMEAVIQTIGTNFSVVDRRGDLELWSIDGDLTLQSLAGNVGIGTETPTDQLTLSDCMRLTPRATSTTTNKGTIYFDSDDNKLKCFDGTIWQNLY